METEVLESQEELELQPSKAIERDRGRITIYDTITGEASEILVTMLQMNLRKRRPDGSRVFTTEKPDFEPNRGTLKCLLHPEGPDREYYDSLGLPTCQKSNLTSPFQVRRHMEKRHRVEWGTIEEDRKAKEKQEERDFQRSLMGRATPQSDKPTCDICGADFGSVKVLENHKKEKHGG